MTVSGSLRGRTNPESQANGALMRISPLGIFGAGCELAQVGEWARQDAEITHPHRVCQEANALFAMGISFSIRNGPSPIELYSKIASLAEEMDVTEPVYEAIRGAEEGPLSDFLSQQGWVLIAFRNALWQLLNAKSTEEDVIDTVMRGGDTDTNAAICGALLGAVHGRQSIPSQWINMVLTCRPSADSGPVVHPRPECFWPVDALTLAERLVRGPGQ
jgi:ADP-ribosylglycohydrolase